MHGGPLCTRSCGRLALRPTRGCAARVLGDAEKVLQVTSTWSVGSGGNQLVLKQDLTRRKREKHVHEQNAQFTWEGFLWREGGARKTWTKRWFRADRQGQPPRH